MKASTLTSRMGVLWLARWSMLVAWLCSLSSLVLTWAQSRWYIFYPHYLPLLFLLGCMVIAMLVGLWSGLWHTIRGPVRWRATFVVFAILPPVGVWCYIGLVARSNWSNRWVPNTFAMRTAKVMGATFMHLEADLRYRQRVESDRIVMIYDHLWSPYVEQVDRPEEDLAAMDRHLSRLEEVLGDSIRHRVYWIRGPVLGSEHLSIHGLALGSAWSAENYNSYRVDRHELAHAALDSFRLPHSDPPYVLHEGWAMSQCGYSQFELARSAAEARAEFPQLSLRDLFGPEWYYRDSGPVYSIGGAFVDFLIRTFDGSRFREFYIQCTPGHVEATCRQIIQVDFSSLESMFWRDVKASLEEEVQSRVSQVVPP